MELQEDAQTTYNHYVEMLNEDENGNVIDESREGWRGSWRG